MGRRLSGSYHKRNDGRYGVKYCGVQRTCKTEAEAKRVLKELRNSAVKQVTMNDTVQTVIGDWMTNVMKNSLKPSSYLRRTSTLNTHIYPTIGNLQLSSLQARDMQNVINDMADAGLSYSSIKKAYEAVDSCLDSLVDARKLTYNPIKGVVLPKARAKEAQDIKFYTQEEINIICAEATKKNANGTYKYVIPHLIVLSANTGMRIGEIASLQWSDVDFKRKTVTINKNTVVVKVDGKFQPIIQNSAKTTSGKRSIPLNNAALNALKKLREESSSTGYLFLTRNGCLYTVANVNKIFKRMLRNCGFGKTNPDGTPGKNKLYSIHSLRHSFASALLAKGADIKKVSEILGHKNVTITYNTYIHFIPKDLADTVKLLD